LFRFLHAADLHLDSPLRGLERYEDAPVEEVRGAPRRALENLVQLALDEEVDFILLAGDLYDGDWRDYNTGLFFVSQMRRLDAQTRPQTLELPELGVGIHGQSFATRSVTRDLAADFPEGDAARFDIGLLHTSLDGRPGHDDYAPCHPDTLRSKGYDYWALGHVHEREIVSEDPWIVFPGNVQGRHARETGAKGCSLVTVENGALVAPPEHRALDVVRWAEIRVDVEGAENGDETIDRVREALETASDAAEGRLLAARLVLRGRSAAHAALVRDGERWIQEYRAQAAGLGEPGVWLEKVRFETRAEHDLDKALERDDALGDLIRLIAGLEEDAPALEEIAQGFGDLARKLPVEIRSGDEPLDPTDVQALRQRLPAVRELLLGRLLDAGGGG
jgi:DNA repair exonuclease SbcCD nuclease subunit